MIDDWLFGLVLAILIIVLAFVGTMFWKMRAFFNPLMFKVTSTFHSTLFGYESAMIELIGPRGYKTHVFPKIVETIQSLGENSDIVAKVATSKTPVEAMEKWIDVMNASGVASGCHLVDKGNDEYIINIPKCALCDPIHDIMGDAKGICPNALTIAAASAIIDYDKVPEIDYSKLTPTGSLTTIKFETPK